MTYASDIYEVFEDEYGDTVPAPGDLRDEMIADGYTATGETWERLAQWDTGIRTGDEMSLLIAAEVYAWAAIALGRAIAAHADWDELVRDADAFGIVAASLEPIDWTHGTVWTEPTGDDEACERVHWELEHAESIASMIGLIIEYNADAGMVEIFRPHRRRVPRVARLDQRAGRLTMTKTEARKLARRSLAHGHFAPSTSEHWQFCPTCNRRVTLYVSMWDDRSEHVQRVDGMVAHLISGCEDNIRES